MHPSNTGRYQWFYSSEKLKLKDEYLITLRSRLVQTGIPSPTFLSGRSVEWQSKQPDGPALAITLRVNVERWKFAERFEDVAARKGAPKDANVLRQIYRAQSLAHTPQTAQMYQTTSSDNSIFVTRHPIILGSLLRRKSWKSYEESPLLCLQHAATKIKHCKLLKSENSILIHSIFS